VALPASWEQVDTVAKIVASEGDLVVEETGLLNNVRAYAIAEKYGIFELEELAKTKFLSQVQSSLLSGANLLDNIFR
jgi:hypothetical protein